MKKEDITMLKLKKKLIYKKKNEVKSNLLKSFIQNNKIPPIYKSFAAKILLKRKVKNYKFKHICLRNNRSSSVYNSTFMSKFGFKNLMLNNKAQNLKINSW
jgi:hypothetical protein